MQNEYYTTQIFVLFSLVPVLNKLPDHQPQSAIIR